MIVEDNFKLDNFKIGIKFKLNGDSDKDRILILLSDLRHYSRTEGCYRTQYEDTGIESYLFKSLLDKYGYTIIS